MDELPESAARGTDQRPAQREKLPVVNAYDSPMKLT
jgi:hypothetical protein